MKNKNSQLHTHPIHYRQGDVLIERVASLPSKLTKAKTDKGRVILAYGEVTGHAHSFTSEDATKFFADDGAEYFEVKGRRLRDALLIVRRWKTQVMVNHPKFGMIEFHVDDVHIEGETVFVDGEFGLLAHDEHTTHAIPAGIYAGGGAGKKVNQREYTPEAIRNVTD